MATLTHGMGTEGPAWLTACATVGALWIFAATWRAGAARLSTAARGVLGGLAALGAASVAYGLLQLAGFEIRWEWIARGTWPALGVAALAGLVEEGAKLLGIALASPPRQGRRGVLSTALSVAAVFAVAEAAMALRGSSWPLALTRAALGPVAHGVLAAPFALSLAEGAGLPRPRLALRLAVAVGLAAFLHGLGDFCVAHAGWGQAGFAAALLAPTLWLYARTRPRPAPLVAVRWAAGSAARSR